MPVVTSKANLYLGYNSIAINQIDLNQSLAPYFHEHGQLKTISFSFINSKLSFRVNSQLIK